MAKLTKMQCARYIVKVLYNSHSLPAESHSEVRTMMRGNTLAKLVALRQMAVRAERAGLQRMENR